MTPSSIIIQRAVRYCAQDRKDAAAMLAFTRGRGKLKVAKRQLMLAGLAGFDRSITQRS